MLRIKFATEKDRIDGNFVLITHTVSRSLRGDVFEIADTDRKLLDEHGLHYTVLPLERDSSDQEIRTPPPYGRTTAERRSSVKNWIRPGGN
jgi:hypothetical protein